VADTTLTVVFDGQVLRPTSPPNLEPNRRYIVTVHEISEGQGPGPADAWDVLEQLAGTIDGPVDWASEHDHYLYGTPKRHQQTPP
jgi:hypothetical protein